MTLHEFAARYLLTLHAAVVAVGLLIYVGVSRALPQRRDPSAAVAWVVALALLPYIAIPLYLMFGSRKLRMRDEPKRLAVEPVADAAEAQSAWARRLGRSMGLAPAAAYDGLRVHADGREARLAALEVIRSATRQLDVCTFILGRDALGDEIGAALKERARAGVQVRLLIDGIGAWLGGRVDLKALRAAGVEVVKFVPPFLFILRGRANLRNHRKMVVADAERLWCGGRNFAAEYFEGEPGPPKEQAADRDGEPPWHDLSFDLAGPLALTAGEQFERDWAYATRTPVAAPCEPAIDPEAFDDRDGVPLAQLVPSGAEQADDTVHSLILSGCYLARRRILAVTPYFVPDAALLMALTLAARRGITVDLVLPARSNHRLADIARHRPVRDLTAAGARIWTVPWMVHAKAVVVDEQIALAGSANLDLRSLFLNYELMVAFYEPTDVRRFAAWIEGERAGAQRFVAREPNLWRDLAEGLLIWLAFQL